MVIDPNILKNIRKVVFLNNEPSQTNVLWAKHEGYNTYSFYLFYEGEWHPTDEITNITISTFSGLISAFTNDAGYITKQQSLENHYTKQQADSRFLTEHQSLADYALKEEIPSIDGLASEKWVQSQGYLTSHQDISGKLDKIEAAQTYQPKGNYLTEHQSLDAYINAAGYNSEEKRIELKHGSNILATIDAKVFIKDGMVDSVVIKNGNIVITFNVDSGKEAISLPITDIFNPANYYNKQAIDLKLSDYALKSDLFSGSYNDLTDKPVIPTVPTNVSAFTNDVGYLTQHQDISGKADKNSTYTKTEVDDSLEEQSDFQRNLTAIMSLSVSSQAGTITSTVNPEWKLVYADAEGRILLGKRQDGTWYFATDLKIILKCVIDSYAIQ
jgi:hypothetical protein